MAIMRVMFAVAGVLLASLVLAGCNGGDDGEGQGGRVVDPARVPSSTPIQNPTLYKISGDQVSTSGGPPVAVTPTGGSATGGGSGSYVVKSGDTCGSIASKFNITVEELLRANRTIDSDCTNLRIDDTLRIPSAVGTSTATPRAGTTATAGSRTPTPGSGSSRTYTVRSGDTCGAIAGNQGVEVSALIAANGLNPDCTDLQIGQVLRIP
jgi:LysM repeat protein